ncbi:squalene--hopene cyclase [Bacillus sp. 1NLA3E]|uniref:squalene--hopene cyclase n=1 Tax=Bacillus sp. 1NLA3E TaxID=666686 RepID=UPI000247ECC0|nr:squalene--hopene cyclase [Bacillus sp. 1NLA3E]AGK54238.1 squalene-hopene cyclase [Bacillus sp. 1NLA3E]
MKKLNVEKEIQRLIDIFRKDQSFDGSWAYPFETGVATDSYMIILLRTLEIDDEELIQELAERLLSKQEKNGAWKLFHDEGDGNITSTTEAYYSLLYSGYYQETDDRIQAAKRFILARGGLDNIHQLAKIMLALTGQYKWPTFFPLPVELMLLPVTFPLNFFSFSVYGRANLSPIMILANKKFKIRTEKSPDLSDLLLGRMDDNFGWNRSQEWRSLHSAIYQGVKSLIGLPERLHKQAILSAKQYMLDRIEPDGTFYSYFSSTFLMIFALLALGHRKDDPIIVKAVDGLKAMKTKINGHTHIQYTTANVWNTSLISYALQETGLSPSDSMVEKANDYLLSRQQNKYGDWRIHAPNGLPGGWGFSDVNTINPDVDDTTATLRAIARKVKVDARYRIAWGKGIQWLVPMQNDDGGWSAFERNINQNWLKWLPIKKVEFFLSDPSTADLTGRTLEFFGSYTKLTKNSPMINKGLESLLQQQEENGSWYGRWGICYLYGTWAAVTGLKAIGVSSKHHSIKKAMKWLESVQNSDGGWGESCKSDNNGNFVPLGTSTLTDTAWALDALIAASSQPTTNIQAGIQYLLQNIEKDDWTTSYPAGQGMAGGFYIHYHSYRYIFPLITLAHYQKRFKIEQ